MIHRVTTAAILLVLFFGGVLGSDHPSSAQDSLQPTVEALSTQVAALQTAVADLEGQVTNSSQTPVPTVESAITASVVSAESGDGTSLASPLPLGTSTQVGDYNIRVLEVDESGGEVTAKVEFAYEGNKTGTIWIDLTFRAIGEEGLGYSNTDEEHSCDEFSSSLFTAPEMFPGASYTSDLCWFFPDEEAEDLVIEIAPLFDFDAEARYFALR